MSINPLKGPGAGGVDPRATDATTPPHGHHHHGKSRAASSDAADQLDLSADAAAIPGTDAIPSGGLTADQLQAITQRLANGEYNSPAGIDRLTTQLLKNPGVLDGSAS